MTKTVLKYITNSIIKDKNNMGNAIIEIITGNNISLENYNIQNMYQFMSFLFSLEIFYYNMILADFEPLIEPFDMKIYMYQIAKMTRLKMDVICNDMINMNISANSMKVLNMFLLKYYQDEKVWKPQEFNKNVNVAKRDDVKPKEEIILQFYNYTGINVKFWFVANEAVKYLIKKDEIIPFTKNSLLKAQQLNKYKNKILKDKFSFFLVEKENISNEINSVDFGKSNILRFQTKLKSKKGIDKDIIFNNKVNTSGIIKTITFFSSLSFVNCTKFDNIILSINDNEIEKIYINNQKDKKNKIPLTWMLSDSIQLFLQLNENDEKIKIYDDFLEIIYK